MKQIFNVFLYSMLLSRMAFSQAIEVEVTNASGSETGGVAVTINTPVDPDNPLPYKIVLNGGIECVITESDLDLGINTCTFNGLDAGDVACLEVFANNDCGLIENCYTITGSNCESMPFEVFSPNKNDALCNNGYIDLALLNVQSCISSGDYTRRWLDNNSNEIVRENLEPGEYCIEYRINDSSQCGSGCYSVTCFEIIQVEVDPLNVEVDIVPSHVCVDREKYISRIFPGAISVNSITGGIPPYSVEWLGLSPFQNTERLWGNQTVCLMVTDKCGSSYYDCFYVPRTGGPDCDCKIFVEDDDRECSIRRLPLMDPNTLEEINYDFRQLEDQVLLNRDNLLDVYSDGTWSYIRNYSLEENTDEYVYDLYNEEYHNYLFLRTIFSGLDTHADNRYDTNIEGDTSGSKRNKSVIEVEILNTFPNPINDRFELEISAKSRRSEVLYVLDVLGKVVYSVNVDLNSGYNLIDIHLGRISDGFYTVMVGSANKKIIVKSSK